MHNCPLCYIASLFAEFRRKRAIRRYIRKYKARPALPKPDLKGIAIGSDFPLKVRLDQRDIYD